MAIMKIKLITLKKHLFSLQILIESFFSFRKAFLKLIYANEINVNIFHSAIHFENEKKKN